MRFRNLFSLVLITSILLVRAPSYAQDSSLLESYLLSANNPSSTHQEPRPFLMSLLALFVDGKNFSTTEVPLRFYPERSNLPLVGDRNRILYSEALQNDPTAPVIFISPGLGSYSFDSLTKYMAKLAYKAGYSVITLPSTTHWTFALGVSTTGRTGYLPDDAKDLYKALIKIKSRLEKNHHLKPRQYALMGYSYGGLDASFLAAEDLVQKVFNFSFVVALNPPLNRSAAIHKLDQYLVGGDAWSDHRRFKIQSYATGKLWDLKYSKGHVTTFNSVEGLSNEIKLSENAIAWLIANQFRENMNESIFVANHLQNTDDKISSSISSYLQTSLFSPLGVKKAVSGESVEQQSEITSALKAQDSALIKENRFILFQSTDDFLSFPEGQSTLDQLQVEKHIYPVGGHMGYVINPIFKAELTKVLKERHL